MSEHQPPINAAEPFIPNRDLIRQLDGFSDLPNGQKIGLLDLTSKMVLLYTPRIIRSRDSFRGVEKKVASEINEILNLKESLATEGVPSRLLDGADLVARVYAINRLKSGE